MIVDVIRMTHTQINSDEPNITSFLFPQNFCHVPVTHHYEPDIPQYFPSPFIHSYFLSALFSIIILTLDYFNDCLANNFQKINSSLSFLPSPLTLAHMILVVRNIYKT
jgi:hypothetical protein